MNWVLCYLAWGVFYVAFRLVLDGEKLGQDLLIIRAFMGSRYGVLASRLVLPAFMLYCVGVVVPLWLPVSVLSLVRKTLTTPTE